MDTFLHFDSNAKSFNNLYPVCKLSGIENGSMRFRWDENNLNRQNYLQKNFLLTKPINIELIHSKEIVFPLTDEDINQMQKNKTKADGCITTNPEFVPIITVADCMPIFLYDDNTGLFGILHSGWKGTGIITNAIQIALTKFNSSLNNLHFILGPHIQNCCYSVAQDRADYFTSNFGKKCISKNNMLSLTQANLYLLEQAGIPYTNITVSQDCTCCKKNPVTDLPQYGSYRREFVTENKQNFTVMLASISLLN